MSDPILYTLWVVLIVFIICGLFAQLEIEQKDAIRRRRRLIMRQTARDEMDRVEFLTNAKEQ